MVDIRHKKGGIVETNLRPLVYESQKYIKKPSFLHWVKPNYESQTKQPKLNHPVKAHRYYHPLYDNLLSKGL
jgi:hypothetical protein